MRVRLALTLSFERARTGTEDAPQVDEKGAAILDRAEAAPVGFALPTYRSDPFEDGR